MGRQILVATWIADEAIDLRKSSSYAGLVGKLDLENTHNHVSWKCLTSLKKLGI